MATLGSAYSSGCGCARACSAERRACPIMPDQRMTHLRAMRRTRSGGRSTACPWLNSARCVTDACPSSAGRASSRPGTTRASRSSCWCALPRLPQLPCALLRPSKGQPAPPAAPPQAALEALAYVDYSVCLMANAQFCLAGGTLAKLGNAAQQAQVGAPSGGDRCRLLPWRAAGVDRAPGCACQSSRRGRSERCGCPWDVLPPPLQQSGCGSAAAKGASRSSTPPRPCPPIPTPAATCCAHRSTWTASAT